MIDLLHLFFLNSYVAVLVEQLLLVVAGYPIALSELEQETRLQLTMSGYGVSAAKVQLNNEFLCINLQTLALEHLIDAEADRINWPAAKASEVESMRQKWMGAFADRDEYAFFMTTNEFTVGDINTIFARHLRVASMISHFVNDRINSERLLSEQAINEYYLAHREQFANQEQAASELAREVREKITGEWLEELLKRHKIQQVKAINDIAVKGYLEDCQINADNLLKRNLPTKGEGK